MLNSISTRPFEKETKSKSFRVYLRYKVDNIVLIGQYRVGHEFNKSQHPVAWFKRSWCYCIPNF